MWRTSIVAGILVVSFLGLCQGDSASDLLHKFAEDTDPDPDAQRLQDYISNLQTILTEDGDTDALQVAGRLGQMTSEFSRGKKADEPEVYRRQLDPDQFFGARGRRAPPPGFLGSRGKRYMTSSSLLKRQPPSGFIVSRGKKDIPLGFFGSRGKKDIPKGFFGSRGKKAVAPPSGFYMPRGRKSDPRRTTIGSRGRRVYLPPSGFFGSRGKKSAAPEFSHSDVYGLPELYYRQLAANLDSGYLDSLEPGYLDPLEPGYSKRDELSEIKREPPRGFLPLRG